MPSQEAPAVAYIPIQFLVRTPLIPTKPSTLRDLYLVTDFSEKDRKYIFIAS